MLLSCPIWSGLVRSVLRVSNSFEKLSSGWSIYLSQTASLQRAPCGAKNTLYICRCKHICKHKHIYISAATLEKRSKPIYCPTENIWLTGINFGQTNNFGIIDFIFYCSFDTISILNIYQNPCDSSSAWLMNIQECGNAVNTDTL